MSKLNSIIFALALLLIVPFAQSQTSVSTLDTPVSENFDGLPNSGAAINWMQNSTVGGWYAYETDPYSGGIQIMVDSGTQASGRLYSYGRAGSSERALGSVSSGSSEEIAYGWRLKNNTGSAVSAITISYTGEQWRAANNTSVHKLAFYYKISSSISSIDSAEIKDFAGNGYTGFSALDFNSIINSTTTTPLDGNDAANSVKISQTISVSMAAGEEIMIAWLDVNDGGSDHGLAIDDLSVSFSNKNTSNPLYPIGTIAKVDGVTGVPDSMGVAVRVQGIVYGINYRPSGLSFTLIDNTGGINIFSSSKQFGYTVTEGDEIIVSGKVTHFRGLTELSPIDTVIMVSSGNALNKAKVVTKLDESAESQLVTIKNLTWAQVKPSTWTANANFLLTNGTDTFTIRVDGDIDLAGTAMPSYDTMSITGLGGQFATQSSGPYLDGYQLFPRYIGDVEQYTDIVDQIGVIAKVDPATGIPDSLNVMVRVKGTVYGINYRAGGLSFTLRDNSGGVNIFEFTNNTGYTVNEGDQLYIEGKVIHFRGLTEISNIDVLNVLSTGNSLKSPVEVTKLGEDTESDLVVLKGVWWAEAKPATWAGGTNYKFTNGTDTSVIRIDDDVLFAGTATPSYDTLNITGIGSQYATSSSAPFLDGYQLFPRYTEDIEKWESPSTGGISQIKSRVSVYPNPSNGSIIITSDKSIESIVVTTISGQNLSVMNGLKQNKVSLNLELPAGMYLLNIVSGQENQIKKIVIK